MDRYITFTEDGIQAESILSEESPGENWYKVSESLDGKFYTLKDGNVKAMNEKDLEDYRMLLDKQNKIFFARMLRNKKLADSDWTQLESSPLSTEKKAEWEAYRQALRNYPALLESNLDAEFPAEPQ
jgi:hypothetical protein